MASTSLPRPHRWRAPRRTVILGAALLVVAGSYGVGMLATRRAPEGPTTGTQAVRQVPIPDGPPPAVTQSLEQMDGAISVWAANVARDREDFISATYLADLYYSRARLTGNLDD